MGKCSPTRIDAVMITVTARLKSRPTAFRHEFRTWGGSGVVTTTPLVENHSDPVG
jgi:hypothetical protein